MSTNLFGIDVSEHQGMIDWTTVKAGPTQFAFIKAWENRLDMKFERNLGELKRVGIPFGVYCFGRPGRYAPEEQARLFHRAAPDCGQLGPVLDMEDHGGLSKSALDDWCMAFLQTCSSLYGRDPLFYSYTSFINSSLPPVGARTPYWYRLWIAEYGKNNGSNHGTSIKYPWVIHQYSSKGKVLGVPGNVDVNIALPSLFSTTTIAEAKVQVPNAVDAVLVPGGPGPNAFGQDPLWVVGSDGGVFAFNGAPFFGSIPALGLTIEPGQRIVSIVSTVGGQGYWLFGADGGVFSFGDAQFFGRPVHDGPTAPQVVGASAYGDGYKIIFDNGFVATYR